ncbi:MAG: TrmB family transcriptional regulator [Candidatus Levyibacteriota bacterium]
MDIAQEIEAIGLTKCESVMYLQLLKTGPLSPTDIAMKTELKRPNVYDVIKSLEKKGLIHYQFNNKRRLISASSPKNLLEIAKQRFDLTKSVMPQLLNLDREQSFQSHITFYQGKIAMQELYSGFAKAKKKEAWVLWSPQDMNKMLGESFVKRVISKRLKRKIKIRSLRPADKESEYEEQTRTTYGRELTEVAYISPSQTFSLSLIIYDDKTAFYSSKKEGFGFLVESREFTEVMRMFYDNLWKHSGKLKK